MNEKKLPADRRRGVTFTMKQSDIKRLDEYVKQQQANLNILGGRIDRQTVLEALVLQLLSNDDKL